MEFTIDKINAPAIALRNVILEHRSFLGGVPSAETLSKFAPYFGFVDCEVTGAPPVILFSNNDDYVAQRYFWCGSDAYESLSLQIWVKLAANSPGILDIGAYTGIYSLIASKVNPKAKCFAFEALDRVYTRLLINKKVNSLGNLSVANFAVSDSESEVIFNVYSGDSVLVTGSSIVTRDTGRSPAEQRRVHAIALDSWLEQANTPEIRLIKIDAEGAEHLVLTGALDTIRKHRPTILCELLPGTKISIIQSFFDDLGYRYFKINDLERSITEQKSLGHSTGKWDLNYLISQNDVNIYL